VLTKFGNEQCTGFNGFNRFNGWILREHEGGRRKAEGGRGKAEDPGGEKEEKKRKRQRKVFLASSDIH